MMLRAAVLVAICLFAGAATAEEAPHEIRQIAPDRFQPNLRDETEVKPAAAAVTPPTKDHPLGSCDKSSRGWITCLRATADLSAILVGAAENQAVASLEQRKSANASLQRVMAKALADADAKWVELRELECNQLALLEAGQGAQLYEAQLICRIKHNMERVDQLNTRYGAGAG